MKMEDIILANEEMNRWCGTTGINYYEGDSALGLLFKFAVPKVDLLQIILQPEIDDSWYCGLNMVGGDGDVNLCESDDKDPAIALFRAIQQAFKEKE